VNNLTSFEDFIRNSENGTSIDDFQVFQDSDDIIVVSPIDFVAFQDSNDVTNLTTINGFEFTNLDRNSTFIPLKLIPEFDVIVNNNETGNVFGYALEENKCSENEVFNDFENKCMK